MRSQLRLCHAFVFSLWLMLVFSGKATAHAPVQPTLAPDRDIALVLIGQDAVGSDGRAKENWVSNTVAMYQEVWASHFRSERVFVLPPNLSKTQMHRYFDGGKVDLFSAMGAGPVVFVIIGHGDKSGNTTYGSRELTLGELKWHFEALRNMARNPTLVFLDSCYAGAKLESLARALNSRESSGATFVLAAQPSSAISWHGPKRQLFDQGGAYSYIVEGLDKGSRDRIHKLLIGGTSGADRDVSLSSFGFLSALIGAADSLDRDDNGVDVHEIKEYLDS
jgi:hypothetical protein